jgi:hypothetical protein
VSIDKLAARIAAAEGKHETLRLAALEWGNDIDTHSRLIDKLWQRVEALEDGATCPHVRSSDEGTSYCSLAESVAAQQPPLFTAEEVARIVAPISPALAQPEPVAPTDEEIEEWADAATEVPLEEMDPKIHGWRRCFTAKEFSETIRAALAKWAHQ